MISQEELFYFELTRDALYNVILMTSYQAKKII